MNKTLINAALALAFGITALSAQAAVLNTGDTLSITAGHNTGTPSAPVIAGSWFAMDLNGDSKIQGSEKAVISQGTNGIVIGDVTTAGPYHGGVPLAGEKNQIVNSWLFSSNTGSNFNTTPITGDTVSGLDMSGWHVAWNTVASISMGTGAWQPLALASGGTGVPAGPYVNGKGLFSWDGVYGHAYTLDYAATVPAGDASGFGNVKYFLHTEGIVSAVPVPAAAWLLGSGLLGMVGVARRKKASAA